MDEHNVHQLWGLSPAVDLLAVFADSAQTSDASCKPLKLLQVCPYDCRHTVQTICRASRHPRLSSTPVHLYVYEDQPELLARHMLLVSILLDEALPVRQRMETFLEVHGNILLRENTSSYVEARSKVLEAAVEETMSTGTATSAIGQLFDLSQLKYQERDGIMEALRSFRKQTTYDVVKGWDGRCRRWYGDRYDFRRNLIDWDYHMRLIMQGTPGQAPSEQCSIIHFYHFRHWRLHGVAYELRDSQYDQPNFTMVTTALGRTKEFKDRNGKDIGRKVSARGFWGDIVNPPYHSFGTDSEDRRFFVVANKQLSHTAVDVMEFNVQVCTAQALVEELRTGELYQAPSGKEQRAKAARGPTTMEDLESSLPTVIEEPDEETAGSCPTPSPEAGCTAASPALPPANKHTGIRKEAYRDQGPLEEQEGAETALQEQEAALNAAAWQRCQQFKIMLVTGDLCKQLTGKQKLAGQIAGATVGHRHIHLLASEHKLQQALQAQSALLVETAKYLLQLTPEQVGLFHDKVGQLAAEAGWKEEGGKECNLPDAHALFTRA